MIKIYTKKAPNADWVISNDLFFNICTGNEDLTDKDVQYIQEIDKASVTEDGHIETKYGIGTIRNLSSGCKTLLNILHHPEKVICVEECGPNVLKEIFQLDNIMVYMSRPGQVKISSDKELCFNDSDIVVGDSGYGSWWSSEYQRRLNSEEEQRRCEYNV